jgi:hypothetical protein
VKPKPYLEEVLINIKTSLVFFFFLIKKKKKKKNSYLGLSPSGIQIGLLTDQPGSVGFKSSIDLIMLSEKSLDESFISHF